jgi:antitoxin YefM
VDLGPSVPVAEAKNRLSEYISEVERTHDRVTITRDGRTAAVLISADDLAALDETVDLLATPSASEAIAEGWPTGPPTTPQCTDTAQ